MKTITAKMLTALLFSLFAMLVSGAPADTVECKLLRSIKDEVDSWRNNKLENLEKYVEDLKESDEHNVQCKITTLCKAEKILSGHFKKNKTEKTDKPDETDKTIRALFIYRKHHNNTCNGTNLENLADKRQVKDFLEDVSNCVQVLYHNCTRVNTSQQ